jgi:hypothetical protein
MFLIYRYQCFEGTSRLLIPGRRPEDGDSRFLQNHSIFFVPKYKEFSRT